MQKHLSPRPELNFETRECEEVIVSFEVSAIAQAAGEVPENFLQLAQWQYRAECNSPPTVKVVNLHKQAPWII